MQGVITLLADGSTDESVVSVEEKLGLLPELNCWAISKNESTRSKGCLHVQPDMQTVLPPRFPLHDGLPPERVERILDASMPAEAGKHDWTLSASM